MNTKEIVISAHMSRKSWFLLRNQSYNRSGKPSSDRLIDHLSPDRIAKWIFGLSKSAHESSDRHVAYKLNEIKRNQPAPLEVSSPFTPEELNLAISTLPAGKTAKLDNNFPEFFLNMLGL